MSFSLLAWVICGQLSWLGCNQMGIMVLNRWTGFGNNFQVSESSSLAYSLVKFAILKSSVY
jgi:hypothetical protein